MLFNAASNGRASLPLSCLSGLTRTPEIHDLYELFIFRGAILTHNLAFPLYTNGGVMKTFFPRRTLIGSVLASLCFFSVACSQNENKGKRSDEPRCQNECLKEHSEKMAMFDKSLSETGNKFVYQNQVEQEESHYANCLTNCREVIPIK
jgi:hypothetical protein